MPTNIQAQVVLPFTTNLPRDVAVNTFGFTFTGEGEPDEDDYDDLTGALADFYNKMQPNGYRIANFISQGVTGAAYSAKIKLYDAASPDYGGPLFSAEWALYRGGGPRGDMPAEVAVCLSFAGDPSPTMPMSRRRGRIFLGPLTGNAATQQDPFPIVASTLQETGLNALAQLYADTTGAPAVPWVWSVWSRTAGVMVPIVRGWVNNEFDTQRRRQLRPSGRLADRFDTAP